MERPDDHLLLTDREATEFRRSRRAYRLILVSGFAVVILLLVTVAPPIVRHIDSVAGLTMAGVTVDWDINGDNWTHGGVTRVESNSGRDMLTDVSLLRLKDLHRVEAVDLADCERITATGLEALIGMRDLRVLDLSRTLAVKQFLEPDRTAKKLTDSALVPLQNLTQLTNLSLASNLITDDGLKMLSGLTNLESLDLSGSLVTDAGLKHLKGLKKLKSLSVLDTKVTKKGALELQETLTGLTEFNINSELTPEAPVN